MIVPAGVGFDEKFGIVFDLAPSALAILDADFKYERVNPAYMALTGYSSDDLIGHLVTRHLAVETEALEIAAMAHAQSGNRWTRRVQFKKKQGTDCTLQWQVVAENPSSVRVLVATDITQELRSAEARDSLLASERAARAEAERSNRLKEEFLATLSHELRNPLNAILGWATVLARKADLPDSMTQGLQAIERNSRLQAKMISDLLDYAGITFGKLRLIAEHIDPYPAIRAALDVVSGAAQAAGVDVRATFSDDRLLIEADESRLQQIVWNLLSNAVKFSSRGGEVTLQAGRSGECLSLVVTDRGRGIEPEYLPRIFERFSQQDATTTRSHGGLGLGLAIVKQLAELHGGSIHAYSAGKGAGATFTVKIPLSRIEQAVRVSDSQILRSLDFSQVVALVVEDDADARELTKRILLDVGATVVEASSAEEAVTVMKTARPNVLISDIGMAHQDGYQLIRQLRAAGHGPEALPAIALTAFARSEDRSEALTAGFQDHLIKPLEPQTLLARIAVLRVGGRAQQA